MPKTRKQYVNEAAKNILRIKGEKVPVDKFLNNLKTWHGTLSRAYFIIMMEEGYITLKDDIVHINKDKLEDEAV